MGWVENFVQIYEQHNSPVLEDMENSSFSEPQWKVD